MAGARYQGSSSGIQATFHFPYTMPADTLRYASISTATTTALWSPVSPNKFRVLGWDIYFTENAVLGTAGNILVSLQDGSTTFWSAQAYLPAAAVAQQGDVKFFSISLNGGYLSTTAGNVLNVVLSAALTGGYMNVTAWGLEEG